MSEVYHTFECTIGIKAKKRKGAITGVALEGAWVTKPDYIRDGVHLVRVSLDVPESMFGFGTLVKGKIESRLQEELEALVEELTDAD